MTMPGQATIDGHANIGLRMMSGVTRKSMADAGRDLTDDQNERLRPLARELVAKFKTQVEAAKAIGLTQPTLSGFISGRQGSSYAVALRIFQTLGKDPASVPGFETLARADVRRSEAAVTVVPDDVHPVIARVAKLSGYTEDEVVVASRSVRGVHGTADMSDIVATELLMRARIYLRDSARAAVEGMTKPEKLPPNVLDDDDVTGGAAAIPKLPARKGRKSR